jgi:hypothetical protein
MVFETIWTQGRGGSRRIDNIVYSNEEPDNLYTSLVSTTMKNVRNTRKGGHVTYVADTSKILFVKPG